MIYQSIPELAEKLLKIPESGMGYQLITAHRNESYRTEKFLVYNTQLIIPLDDNFETNKKRIFNEGFQKVYSESRGLNLSRIHLFKEKISHKNFQFSEVKKTDLRRNTGRTGAEESTIIVVSDGNKMFVRLSAFENDRRVDRLNGKFLPGTYTTTREDYLICKEVNDNPIDRYALPNNETIHWVFTAKPKKGDKYKYGVVQPNFGHQGGGIECLFIDGTSQNTIIGTARI